MRHTAFRRVRARHIHGTPSVAARHDKVNGSLPCLPLARRIILTASPAEPDADRGQASAAALDRLLSALSSLVGEAGSAMVIRRSLRLTEAAYPWLEDLRRVSPGDLTAALAVALSTQPQDVAEGAAIAVVASLLELLATLIGERLVRHILEETWPDVFPASS